MDELAFIEQQESKLREILSELGRRKNELRLALGLKHRTTPPRAWTTTTTVDEGLNRTYLPEKLPPLEFPERVV